MTERDKFLNMHKNAIYPGSDGKWYTYLPNRKKKKRNTKKEIEDLVVDYWKAQSEKVTLFDVFTEWNDTKLSFGKIQPSTHSRNQRLFNRHFKEIQDMDIKKISPIYLEDYIEKQISEHQLTVKAFSSLKNLVRGFMKRAKKNNLVTFSIEDVFKEMDLTEQQFRKVFKEDYEEVFSEEELPILIKYLQENLDLRNMGILVMLLTGVRVGELVTLKHEDFEVNTFRVRRTETRYKDKETGKDVYDVKEFTKTSAGMRTAIIPPDYEWIVKKLKMQNPFGDYIFFENGKRLTTNSIRQRMYRVCKRLNIHPRSPHKCRKTYGTILIDNHVDKRLIIDVMGHTDILCTETHYLRNRKSIERKTEILGGIPDFMVN